MLLLIDNVLSQTIESVPADFDISGNIEIVDNILCFWGAGAAIIETNLKGDVRVDIYAKQRQAGIEDAGLAILSMDIDTVINILSEDFEQYSFNLNVTDSVMMFAFLNDYTANGQDRNLYLQKLIITSTEEKDTVIAEIEWNPVTDEDLAGYKIYWGFESRNYLYTKIVQKNISIAKVELMERDTTYYFTLTSFDNSGNESGYSVEVFRRLDSIDFTPPSIPIIIRLEYNYYIPLNSIFGGY